MSTLNNKLNNCLGLNFINVLHTAFTRTDPECAKKTVKSAVLFGAFGTYGVKAVRRTLM